MIWKIIRQQGCDAEPRNCSRVIEWSPMKRKLIPLLAVCAIAALAESKHSADEAAIHRRLVIYIEVR